MAEPTLVFIGCGAAALAHARTLRAVAPAVARFYASRSSEKARSFSESYRGAGWFNSYDGALADARMDVAVITTPPATHYDLALAALRARMHVIVEKPAFLSTDEFDAVISAARHADRRVLVAENYFYKPSALLLRELIAARAIGELRIAWINALKSQRPAGWRADPALAGGGPVFEGGVHWINLLANLGPRIESLTIEECGGPLTALIRVRYAGGAHAVLAYSWELGSVINGVRISRIFGTAGTITFESNGAFVHVRGRTGRLRFPGLRDITGTRAMWSDFLTALRNGTEPTFTLACARQDVALLADGVRTQPTVEMIPCS